MLDRESTSSLVGLTSTIPVEVLFAAGVKPVDLNNIFITAEAPEKLLTQAEHAGFAHNICAWIKGIYSVVMSRGIKRVIAVTGGDCSNSIALGEVLRHRGVEVIPFAYPLDRDKSFLGRQIDSLRHVFSATWSQIESTKARLDRIREKLRDLDRMTYAENVVKGFENHLFLVSSSDFNSDPAAFEDALDHFLIKAHQRKPMGEEIRLGYLGVPPVIPQIYESIEALGARVVFNEVQRQFSMPFLKQDLIEQYLRYTYPYDVQARIDDIKEAIEERHLHGLIHYTQTFCHRQIYDILFRETLPLPILTIEGDRPGNVDSRIAIRLETFIQMLKDRREG